MPPVCLFSKNATENTGDRKIYSVLSVAFTENRHSSASQKNTTEKNTAIFDF